MYRHAKSATATAAVIVLTALGAAPAGATLTHDGSTQAVRVRTAACLDGSDGPFRTRAEKRRALARCLAGEEPGADRRSLLLRTSAAYRDKLRGDEWVFTGTG